jgi:hypothetical protein
LIERYFGAAFSIGRLRDVVGFVVAAAVGNFAAALGCALAYNLIETPVGFQRVVWDWFEARLAATFRLRRWSSAASLNAS